MIEYDLFVHVGVGDLRFGMARSSVRDLLGAPSRTASTKEFFADDLLHVHYTALQEVELIVLVRGLSARLDGVDLLSLDAQAAIAAASLHASVDSADPEYPASATFPAIDLNLWRSALPEESGDPAHMRFEAVGLGMKGYFSRHRRG